MAEDEPTRDHTQAQANRIMEYWGRRGYKVGAVVSKHDSGFAITTDMVNGWPREVVEQRRRIALGAK